MNESLLSYIVTLSAFAFFVVCPRLGAMTNLLNKHAPFSIYRLVILGTFASIPLLILMTWMIRHWGLMAGLDLAVATDLAAAVILTSVSIKWPSKPLSSPFSWWPATASPPGSDPLFCNRCIFKSRLQLLAHAKLPGTFEIPRFTGFSEAG